ncbi:MAG: TIGR04283 family arsenosugar biosynthesis glycosyltransferase [Desulfuromonadaceae bacterium]
MVPKLSIIVPVLNEAATLPGLLQSLAMQSERNIELIVVDGGSTDGTGELLASCRRQLDFPLALLATAAGRGRQLNVGAQQARGDNLLFLHADCRFHNPRALAESLSCFSTEIARRGDDALAGRFALCFSGSRAAAILPFAYYESKARLNRPGCIHGDQGILLRRNFFDQIGRFDESLPYLEDERLAAAVFRMGQWLLLPAEIHTSARRFEEEGLFPRQLLNALILGAEAAGLEVFLRRAPALYRQQNHAERLALLPFFLQLTALFRQMPWRQRIRTWYRAGRFLRDNGWQLLLVFDVWSGVRQNSSYRGEATPVLDRFAPWFDRFTDHVVGHLLATVILWSLIQGTTQILRAREALVGNRSHPAVL